MIHCENCSNSFEGKFCNQCGQKATVKRITLKSVFAELIKKITIWDKGLMYTTVQLMTGPGRMAYAYIQGRRVNFTKPLTYILLTVTASMYFFPKKDFEQVMNAGAKKQATVFQSADWLFSNMGIIYLFLLPFLAWVSRWFNRKSRFNFAEQFVFYAYLMAGCTIVIIPFTCVLNIMDVNTIGVNPLTILEYICWLLFFAWGYVQFYGKQKSYWGGIQGLLVLFISYILYIFAFGLIFTIAIIIDRIFHLNLFTLPNTALPTQ